MRKRRLVENAGKRASRISVDDAAGSEGSREDLVSSFFWWLNLVR